MYCVLYMLKKFYSISFLDNSVLNICIDSDGNYHSKNDLPAAYLKYSENEIIYTWFNHGYRDRLNDNFCFLQINNSDICFERYRHLYRYRGYTKSIYTYDKTYLFTNGICIDLLKLEI